MLTPDITVLSVGTEIMYGESMIPDSDWEQLLNKNWNRNIVTEETAKYPELSLQVWYTNNSCSVIELLVLQLSVFQPTPMKLF